MRKRIAHIGRWIARRLPVQQQALLTCLYVMYAVTGFRSTAQIVFGVYKEMQAHQKERMTKRGNHNHTTTAGK